MADAVLPAHVVGGRAGFALFEDADDLRFSESGFSQRVVPFEAKVTSEFSTYLWATFGGTRQRLYLRRCGFRFALAARHRWRPLPIHIPRVVSVG